MVKTALPQDERLRSLPRSGAAPLLFSDCTTGISPYGENPHVDMFYENRLSVPFGRPPVINNRVARPLSPPRISESKGSFSYALVEIRGLVRNDNDGIAMSLPT